MTAANAAQPNLKMRHTCDAHLSKMEKEGGGRILARPGMVRSSSRLASIISFQIMYLQGIIWEQGPASRWYNLRRMWVRSLVIGWIAIA